MYMYYVDRVSESASQLYAASSEFLVLLVMVKIKSSKSLGW